MARRLSAAAHELALAQLAQAGIREVVQANVTPGVGAVATYEIVDVRTRRALVIHIGAAGSIRFKYRPQGVAGDATATSMPIPVDTAFFVDCEKGDILSFFGVPGSVVVHIMEIE